MEAWKKSVFPFGIVSTELLETRTFLSAVTFWLKVQLLVIVQSNPAGGEHADALFETETVTEVAVFDKVVIVT